MWPFSEDHATFQAVLFVFSNNFSYNEQMEPGAHSPVLNTCDISKGLWYYIDAQSYC